MSKMTHPSPARTTSFAKSASPASEPFTSAPSVKAQFAHSNAPQRGSHMVRQDQPKPVHRPSQALAQDADRGAFNARWQAERQNAANDAGRQARKAEFKAARQSISPKRDFNRSR